MVVESSTLPPRAHPHRGAGARGDATARPAASRSSPQKAIEESRARQPQGRARLRARGARCRRASAPPTRASSRSAAPSLRNNFHLRGLNILIDGFPYGNADGFSDFESLELLTTKHIEVFKGANALRFGGNTLGGAINLVTKTGYDAGLIESRVEGGSYGFFKSYVGTGQVYGPLDLYASFSDTELQGFRDYSQQTRYRAYGSRGYQLSGGATVRFDLGYVHSKEQLPGALTPQQIRQNPQPAEPGDPRSPRRRATTTTPRGAVTFRTPIGQDQAIEWATQLNYQDLDHPLSFAVIDQTTYSYSTELRYLRTAPLFGRGNRFTAGFQFFGTSQTDAQFQNVNGNRGSMIKNQENDTLHLRGCTPRTSTTSCPPWRSWPAGGCRSPTIRCATATWSTATSRTRPDFFGASPKVGFVWTRRADRAGLRQRQPRLRAARCCSS